MANLAHQVLFLGWSLFFFLRDGATERFPTYYMENHCGHTISGHETARIEISQRLIYRSNMNCKVFITVPHGQDLYLYFKRFSLERSINGTCLDYLNIMKGPAADMVYPEPMCGEKLPWTVNVEASQLMLQFVSDDRAEDLGFEIVFVASRTCLGLSNSSALRCSDDDVCFDQSLICDRVQQCPDGRDESNCIVPAPPPDETIPIITGSTLGGVTVVLLLTIFTYFLVTYIQEKQILKRAAEVNLDDTYPITDLYRTNTFLGPGGVRERRPHEAPGQLPMGIHAVGPSLDGRGAPDGMPQVKD